MKTNEFQAITINLLFNGRDYYLLIDQFINEESLDVSEEGKGEDGEEKNAQESEEKSDGQSEDGEDDNEAARAR